MFARRLPKREQDEDERQRRGGLVVVMVVAERESVTGMRARLIPTGPARVEERRGEGR